jgi:hypothetical protein
MCLLRWLDPLPVQIRPREVAAVVSDYHPVYVQHGHDLEDEVFTQTAGSGAVAKEEVDDVLYDVAGHRLPRVHPRRQDDRLLLLAALSDRQVVATASEDDYLLPDSVRHRNFRWNLCFLTGSFSRVLRYFWRRV